MMVLHKAVHVTMLACQAVKSHLTRLFGLPLVLILLYLSLAQPSYAKDVYQPALLAGPTGQTTTLMVAPNLWTKYADTVHDGGRVLLQSNNPEYVSEPGIMYRDTINGQARLNLYHATRGERAMRYSIVLRNHSNSTVTVIITRKGVAGPNTNYPRVGQDVVASFWGELLNERLIVPPGEQRHLDPGLINRAAAHNALVHGRYDIETDGPLEVAFVADYDYLRFEKPNLDYYTEFMPTNARMRGTYPTSARHVTFSVGEQRTALLIAANRPPDPDVYMFGTDAMDGTTKQNFGNYGVTYHIDVLMHVSKPHLIRLYLGPGFSGGSSCAMDATILLTDGEHDNDVEKGRVLRLPRSRDLRTVGIIGETVVLPDEPRVLRFDFMPPGGACLPALFFAVPEAITQEEAAAWYRKHH